MSRFFWEESELRREGEPDSWKLVEHRESGARLVVAEIEKDTLDEGSFYVFRRSNQWELEVHLGSLDDTKELVEADIVPELQRLAAVGREP